MEEHSVRFRHGIWPAVCLGTILLLSLIPLWPQVSTGVPNPAYLESFYTPGIRAVAEGHLLVGNPYFIEHRDDITPAIVLPFWLSALPLAAGLPLSAAAAVNFSLWSLAFGIVVYLLLRIFGLPERWSAVGALVAYVQFYGALLRPVVMQLVYPSFLFFMFAFVLWKRRQLSWRYDALLGLAAALAIYMYPYQAQIVGVFLVLVFAWSAYRREWQRVRHLFIVAASIAVLCLPYLCLTLVQLQSPFYADTVGRDYGIGRTHWPSGQSYLDMVHMLTLVVLAYTVKRLLSQEHAKRFASVMGFMAILGVAIIAVSFSNVITGIDLETASHIARYAQLWIVVGSIVMVYALVTARATLRHLSYVHKALVAFLCVLAAYSYASYGLPTLEMLDISEATAQIQDSRSSLPALRWLDIREAEPVVVWVAPRSALGPAIVLYTKHSVLFTTNGILSLMSSDEAQERYLLASSLSDMSPARIREDLNVYGTNGYALDTPYVMSRGARTCRALHIGLWCGALVTADDVFTPLYAVMWERYTTDTVLHQAEEVRKFHVSYIMKDMQTDTDFHPEKYPAATLVYDDGRYEIFSLGR